MNRPLEVLLFIGVLLLLIVVSNLPGRLEPTDRLAELQKLYPTKHQPGTDHSKLSELQREFDTPQDVSRACASCHTERHAEMMRTPHWRWLREEHVPGRGVLSLGKRNVINNFCIGTAGSEQSCHRCHAGYGWSDSREDFIDPDNVDCLACHDNTGGYIKEYELTGYPATDVDLGETARHVGRPTNINCGNCHFSGGGGNNVKHGDLEEALYTADRQLDVHMALEGAAMKCIDCHGGDEHNIRGKLYTVSSTNRNRVRCEDCHGNLPHRGTMPDEHTMRVACQTCHIPTYAKANATKMTWDWSTAGRLLNGEPYEENDEQGNHTYLSIKGSFTWDTNVEPEYCWFNGTADHHLLGDTIDTTAAVQINRLLGSPGEPGSQIIPVKVHRTRQIYDRGNLTLIQPRLFAADYGEGAFWKDFDWDAAARAGMAIVNLPYSGDYDFIDTEMSWPVNHMVGPADKVVSCGECHKREQGRLANLSCVYLPGRDNSPKLDAVGRGLLLLSLAGVLLHLLVRLMAEVYRLWRKER